MTPKLTFRFDDIGASSKLYTQHGKKVFRYKNVPFFYFPLANFWFFKRIWPFAKAGPYAEISVQEWESFLQIFQQEEVHPLIAITAAWVEKDGSLTPFPEKFPEEAALLKRAFQAGRITLANHGLTHCIVGKHLPQTFGSNREFHREFWPSLDEQLHQDHVLRSQAILEDYFGAPITLFVPPGNVWSKKTYTALLKTHIRTVIADRYMLDSQEPMKDITFIADKDGYQVFHDRDLKKGGVQWLKKTIAAYKKSYSIV